MERAQRTAWYLRPLTCGLILFALLVAGFVTSVGFYAWRRADAIGRLRNEDAEIEFSRLPGWVPRWLDDRCPD
jgi:hypothetical protein